MQTRAVICGVRYVGKFLAMLFQGGLVDWSLHRDVELYLEIPRPAQGTAIGSGLIR